MIIGVGLVYTNVNKISDFEAAYQQYAAASFTSEFECIKSTLKEYNTIVFKAIRGFMVIASLLIIVIDKPVWRASCITTIAMMIVILLIDGKACGRIDHYKKQLHSIVEAVKK